MARYLVTQSKKDIVVLLPMDKFNSQKRTIEVSEDLFLAPPKAISSNAGLKLMMRLSKTSIGRSKDGFVTDGCKTTGINYDDAIASICNKEFSEIFEDFYCILRKHGITF